MARFVIANRRAGKFTTDEKLESREAMESVMKRSEIQNSTIVSDTAPPRDTDRRVAIVEANAAEIAQMEQTLPQDVIVEPEILHYTRTDRLIEFARVPHEVLDAPVTFGQTKKLSLKITGSGAPLEGANVILFLRFGPLSRRLEKTSNKNGKVKFDIPKNFSVAAGIIIPAGGFWTMVDRSINDGDTIDCIKLPDAGENLGWHHKAVGVAKFVKKRGKGVRVGVADTGCGPHGLMNHVTNIGAFIDGAHLPGGGADVDSHGTHVCGTIGARPDDDTEYGGIAPAVDLFSARVFPPNSGANQADISNAIDALSMDHEVDIINLSLGAPTGSQIEHDAIIDAAERGTLCVCAAANSNGPVEFPAAFPETLAISAIGLTGVGPTGTMASLRLPQELERFGVDNLYHANFSCFGPEITGAGPGVGVIAPVPERFGLEKPFAAMGGTSMASPSAAAALAAVLANDAIYASLPRNDTRTEHARTVFLQSCKDIGLKPIYQGAGMMQAAAPMIA